MRDDGFGFLGGADGAPDGITCSEGVYQDAEADMACCACDEDES